MVLEGCSQTVGCGTSFVALQLHELLYGHCTISDTALGSSFHLACGLHGIHVLLGCSVIALLVGLASNHLGRHHWSAATSLASYYWHLIDYVWFMLFSVYFVILQATRGLPHEIVRSSNT